MGLADALEDERRAAEQARRKPPTYPKGWEPRVEESGDTALAVSVQMAVQNADERTLLEGWRLDPDVWRIIDGTLTVNRWQQHEDSDAWLYQYKARLEKWVATARADVDELLAGIGKWRRTSRTGSGNVAKGSFPVFALSDWQIGKGDGDGVEGTIGRIVDQIGKGEDLIDEWRKLGRPVDTLYVVGMGDLSEGCAGNYPSQPFTVELNQREQDRVTRRLLRDAIIAWSRKVPRMVVGCVPGNHGENRQGGKAFTGPGDNRDVGVFEPVAEALAQNDEAFGHVSWVIPKDETTITLDVGGRVTAFSHGHLALGGGAPSAKAKRWWEGQTFGGQPAGDALTLVTGHYHHFSVVDHGPRVWVQCPANDGGSRWWQDATGAVSRAGMLTFLSTPEGPNEFRIL
ncbi:MAG TPA: hypothetical protein PLY51_15440, partial [Microthrixaceae bacterium]|nr:hypothetical protein [Microthrixaceae bacterium]